MKTKAAILSLFIAGLGLSAFGGNLVTLTSSDGSKTMEASIEQYYPENGSATINVKGRKLTVPISAFQSEDRAKFDNWHIAKLAGRQLMLSFADNETEGDQFFQELTGCLSVHRPFFLLFFHVWSDLLFHETSGIIL